LKVQAGSVDWAAGTGCEASPRCRRVNGRIERRASTGEGIAGAHQRFDPQPGKTGGGEQRELRHAVSGCHVPIVHAGWIYPHHP